MIRIHATLTYVPPRRASLRQTTTLSPHHRSSTLVNWTNFRTVTWRLRRRPSLRVSRRKSGLMLQPLMTFLRNKERPFLFLPPKPRWPSFQWCLKDARISVNCKAEGTPSLSGRRWWPSYPFVGARPFRRKSTSGSPTSSARASLIMNPQAYMHTRPCEDI